MTLINITDDEAYTCYCISGWLKYTTWILLSLPFFNIIYSDLAPFNLGVSVVGIIIFSMMLTYRVETKFNNKENIVTHKLSVLGIPKYKELLYSDIHISARLHSTRHVTYPIFWIISKDNKKYKIGEFFQQDLSVLADKLQKNTGLDYHKTF
jgi:hypothetical protein